MLDRPFLYFLAKIIATLASITLYYSEAVDITIMVISALSFACIFVLELLLKRLLKENKKIIAAIAAVSVIICFMLDLSAFFPLVLVLLTHIMDLTLDQKMFYQFFFVVALLLFLIFPPQIVTTAISATLMIMLLFCRSILIKLEFYMETNLEQRETIGELNKNLTDLRSLRKTLKYTASVEERNRIAAKIHDQLGHGISGSIILLEAAMLIMKDNPEKAALNIQKATTNLREGVDEIRASLREERADHYLLGKNDIIAMLEEFKVNYHREATLKTSGDLDYISLDVWTCIHDNLRECLTNVLKHSNATQFQLSIDVFQKIIKVEYKDNGKSDLSFVKGLGLEAIEERTALMKGRCFFNKGINGFSITNIFSY